jgi:hypothetical protein
MNNHNILSLKWEIPVWYIIGIYILNVLSFSFYYILRGTQSFFWVGVYNLANLAIVFAWFVINIVLLILFVRKKFSSINFIFPVYFIFIDLYIFSLYYLALFRNTYTSQGITDALTAISTIFELSLATLILFMKYRHGKKEISESARKSPAKQQKTGKKQTGKRAKKPSNKQGK